ncbi:MAG: type VI secretion system baseplate subunit TssK [Desulfobacteraceae bacterium]|nr:type VI secretion system baseplate subunit TssK [Desulfobacteraceae bacterium]MBC2754366.1 type VI secretion system baseplate subunit TssK [Desulfobacteraceae bacterium]
MERPLFWHQGLFLQPQHFQLKDLHDQSRMTPFSRYLNPHFWGVADIEIQHAALGNHSFNFLKATFLFPDMTYVDYPGNAVVQARSFESAWSEGGKRLPVYVGIKKFNDAGENVTVLSSLSNLNDVTTRFVTTTDAEEIQDLHHNGPPAQVKKLYYVLKIFFETEKDLVGDYELIPLASLERDSSEIILSEKFIPPCISFDASGSLYKIVSEIRDQIASRARQLEAYKRDRGVHSAEFGARDMIYFLALRSLNRYVPMLMHLTETRRIHPWTVYGVLRQLAGELSSFSGQISVAGETPNGEQLLRAYDHRNLGVCFSDISDLIIQLLDEITAGPEYIIQLMYDETYYAADLQPAIFEGRNRFFLVFTTDTDPQPLIHDAANIAKLGSREILPILIARALPGIRLEHFASPPQELPRRANSVYFQIDHHSDHWEQVKREKNLALYWDAAPQDLKIELMAVGGN